MENASILELRDVREGPQSAEKFEIPAGYRKFDVHQLFERLKHSDVWVEPVH